MTEEVYRSTVAQGMFYVDGVPLSLEDYPMFGAIYDGKYPRLLMKTGRQVTKSTTIACFMIAEALATPNFKSFYIAPSQEQTRKFSHTRIAKILAYSPDLRRGFVNTNSIDNVLLRMFSNGSEMAFTYALDDPDRARGYSADRCCFDANAEVLTRKGWRLVRDVTKEDELADVNDAGVIEWHTPSQLVQYRHQGPMVQFNHRGVSLRVTHNHKMWANYAVKTNTAYTTPDTYAYVDAIDLAQTPRMGFKFTGEARVTGTSPAVQEFAGGEGYRVSLKPLQLPYDSFAELLGWYIAEGSMVWKTINGRRACAGDRNIMSTGFTPKRVPKGICITQCPGAESAQIEACLRKCGLKYARTQTHYTTNAGPRIRHTYVINSAQLGNYCAAQGLSRDKYIPQDFFEHPEALKRLLTSLYAGDATKRDQTLRTRSRRLADDVHRAQTLLGYAAVVHTRMMPPRKGAPAEPLYEVQVHKHNHLIFWRSEFKTKTRVVVEEHCDEDVYCFTIKHHRPIVRGRFGQRPLITGQCFDEVQDILYEAVIPVVEECMSNSPYQYSVYAGTPKTMENTIEFLWTQSTQTEWCMRCTACNKWTFIDSVRGIGKLGPVCLACGTCLDPRKGQWVDMNLDKAAGIKGFHVSQAIMPVNVPASWAFGSEGHTAALERWKKLLYKMESPLYGEARFLNECIGASSSKGARLLTKELLESLCDERHEMTRLPLPLSKEGIVRTVAGVDWSGGGAEIKGSEGLFKSRTVLHIWGQQADGRLKTLFYKVFPNGHAVGWVDEIVELCNAWGVNMVVGDAGEGAIGNSYLRAALGDHRVVAIRYMSLSKPVMWSPEGLVYNVDRTTLIDNYARFLLHKQALYPKIAQAQQAFNDILNVYEEVTEQGRRVWRHSPAQPDDCLHAGLFGWFAYRLLMQDFNFL
jgi:hypothetical protein